MKSIKETKAQPRELSFPCLLREKEESRRIVLFITNGNGTVVWCPPKYSATLGGISQHWIMEEFEPFIGTVTLVEGE